MSLAKHRVDTFNPEMRSNIPVTSQAEETPLFSTGPPNILTCPVKSSLATSFNDIIKWPGRTAIEINQKKIVSPCVISSDKWIEFHDNKACEKLKKEKQKEEKN